MKHACHRVLFLVLAALAACSQDRTAPRSNVLLVSLDTCRRDALGVYGAERKTPRLDAFAEECAVFDDCLAQSSATAPSHLSILTGQHVQRHGLLKNGERSVPVYTLASVLRDAGYRTAAFTGHGSLQGKFGHGVGFQVFISWHLGDQPSDAEGAAPYQRYIQEAIDEGLAFLDEYGNDGPWFLFVHGYDPHLPYWPKEPLRSEFAGWYEGDIAIADIYKRAHIDPLIEEGRLGPDEKRYLRDLYDAEVRAADDAIGDFFDELEGRGLLDETLVVFTSDHGELIGEHEWVGHGTFYEDVFAVPLLLRFPGAANAGHYDAPVQHVDILPTVLGHLGLAAPEGVQGVDLMALFDGRADPWPADLMRIGRREDDVAVAFADRPELRVMFHHGPTGLVRVEVYDIEKDPGQTDNLAVGNVGAWGGLLGRYLRWRRDSAAEDESYRLGEMDVQDEDLEMLRELGYIGEESD